MHQNEQQNYPDEEIWKDVPEFKGLYQASTHGRIRSVSTVIYHRNGRKQGKEGRVLVQKVKNNGYSNLHLSMEGVSYHRTAHRLVATTFLPKIDGKTDVNHKDGNKLNNHVSNLEWVSKSENSLHAYRLKLLKANPRLGEDCHFSKLRKEMVIDIRKTYSEIIKSLAIKYHVSKSTIRAIVNNTAWRSIIETEQTA